MKTLLNVLAIVFLVFGLVFAILPLGTIALLPVGLALIFAAIALLATKDGRKKTSIALLVIGLALGLTVIIKNAVITDRVSGKTSDEEQRRELFEQEDMDLLDSLFDDLDALEEVEDLE